MRSRRALLATFVALTLSTAGGVDAAGATKVTTTPALPATLDAATLVTKAKVNLRQTTGKIVFMSTHDGNPEIYAVNPDGAGLVRLTDSDVGDAAPAWSPDGTRIAFACGIGPVASGGFSTVEPSDICVMDADGRGSVRLTNDPVSDGDPTWSPDGRRIAFRRAADIYTMKPDGTGITRLTTDASASEPAWSHDGTRIAYVSLQSPCPGGCPLPNPQPFVPQIFVMNADGTRAVNLTNDATTEARHPAWSPDGTRIAYDAHPSDGGEVAIWLMNPDGSARVRLPPAPGNDSEPAWSPDGTKIVFTRYGDNLGDIFIRNTDGTGAVAVTNLPGFDASPDWQPMPNGRSWNATIADAGLSGTAALALPAHGWATVAFTLRRLAADVPVSARVAAGAPGCAEATTVVRLPGSTTTTRGTWRQRWVFDGVSLDRLRAAVRNGTRLWFEVGAGEHRTCAPLRPVGP